MSLGLILPVGLGPSGGGSGVITAGTTGRLPKYTAAQTLGNSGIFDAGGGEYTFAANGVSGVSLVLNVASVTSPGRSWIVADRTFTYTAPTTDDTDADVMWGASAAGKTALHLQAAGSQTANLFETSSSAGVLWVSVSSAGALNATKGIVSTGSADSIQGRVIGFTNQTAAIFSVESGDGELVYQAFDPSQSTVHKFRFDVDSINDHWSITNSGSLTGSVNAGTKMQLVANQYVPSARFSSDTLVQWDSNSSLTGTLDTGLARASSGVVKAIGESGAAGWIQNTAGDLTNTSDQTVDSTTMANATALVTPSIPSGAKIEFVATLIFEAGDTLADGVKIDFDQGSATATYFIADAVLYDGGVTAALTGGRSSTLAADISAAVTTSATFKIVVTGHLVVNAAGTFGVRFAKVADAGTGLTLKRGSSILLKYMP